MNSNAESQIIKTSNLLFVKGQLAHNPSGNVVASNDPEKQFDYIFNYIGEILNVIGMTFDNVVKISMFINNMDHFQKISAIRDFYFKSAKPACTMIEIDRFNKEICIEIEVVAVKTL